MQMKQGCIWKVRRTVPSQSPTGLTLCKNSLSELQLPYIGWCGWQQFIALFTCVCSLWGEKKHCSFNTLGIFSQWEYNFANWNLIEKHLSFLLIHCLSLLPLGSLILSIFFCHNRVCILFWLACTFTSQTVKNLPATRKNPGSVPGSSRFPGGGNGYPFQYSCMGEFHEQRSLVGYNPWCRKESDTTEWQTLSFHLFISQSGPPNFLR